ncbi:sensor histidine kinase [Saccharothrix isguenensis]
MRGDRISDLRERIGPWATRAVVALLFGLAAWALVRRVLPEDWSLAGRLAVGLALAASQSVPVLWWRRKPVVAWAALFAACGAAHLVELWLGMSTGSLFTPGQFGMVLVLYGLGFTQRQVVAGVIAAVTLVCALLVQVSRTEVVVLAVVTAVLLGGSRAARVEIARALAVREERTRIARELHDVVAHHMSVLAVQAETAPYRLDGLTPEAEQQFREVAAKARASLNEMRGLLGTLRGGESVELSPQPTLDQVESLVESVRRVGTPVALEFDERLRQLEPLRGLSIYRIVQESLSNALKHAAGQPLDVRVVRHGGAVHVHVRNPLLTTVGGAGQGISGMRERVDLLGGTLVAGPDGAGHFVVDALIPDPGGAR